VRGFVAAAVVPPGLPPAEPMVLLGRARPPLCLSPAGLGMTHAGGDGGGRAPIRDPVRRAAAGNPGRGACVAAASSVGGVRQAACTRGVPAPIDLVGARGPGDQAAATAAVVAASSDAFAAALVLECPLPRPRGGITRPRAGADGRSASHWGDGRAASGGPASTGAPATAGTSRTVGGVRQMHRAARVAAMEVAVAAVAAVAATAAAAAVSSPTASSAVAVPAKAAAALLSAKVAIAPVASGDTAVLGQAEVLGLRPGAQGPGVVAATSVSRASLDGGAALLSQAGPSVCAAASVAPATHTAPVVHPSLAAVEPALSLGGRILPAARTPAAATMTGLSLPRGSHRTGRAAPPPPPPPVPPPAPGAPAGVPHGARRSAAR